MLFKATTFAMLATGVFGHAVMTIPTPRKTGPVQEALCGAAVTEKLQSDKAGPIENAMAVADDDYNCNAYLCRGYQYEDNENNVRPVKAGDVIVFHIDLIAGHRPGYSNMSVVDLETNKAIGSALISWDEWPVPDLSNYGTDFNVTIPDSLSSACNIGGKCVLQWYWYASGNKQTYESCLDFYVES